ncbi:MAG TPA: hypothetical protein VLH12_01225 [Usitatibacter sp.]|nr:hypothetical protein [Usitatibacter sp.]
MYCIGAHLSPRFTNVSFDSTPRISAAHTTARIVKPNDIIRKLRHGMKAKVASTAANVAGATHFASFGGRVAKRSAAPQPTSSESARA